MKPVLAALLMLLVSTTALQTGVIGLTMASPTSPHAPVLIVGNSGFTQANGVTGGSGSQSDPFVIGQWQITATTGNGVTIANTTSYFVVEGVAVSSAIRGVYFYNVTNGLVRNSAISASGDGVLVSRSSSSAISNNAISSSSSNGVSVDGSSSTSISNNVLSNNTEGILIQGCTRVSVVGNQIYSAQFRQTSALVVKYSPNSIVSKNNIWWSGDAVSLSDTPNALVSGNNMSYNAGTAMRLTSSPSANITGNYFAHNIIGMSLMSSDNSSITSSTFYWNNVQGMSISSNNVTISKNVIALNGAGVFCCGGKVATIRANNFTIDGLSLGYFPSPQPLSYTVTTDNLVNGKPLRFYSGCSSLDINGISVGELILMNCNNVRITNLKIFYSVVGIELANVNNTLITSNSLNSNTYAGISLMGNNITVTGNNISNNWVRALNAVSTTGLLAYHNNFFYNEITDAGLNYRIDNGYPSGGNYWARYKGADNCSGPNQNICPNPDGIGDTPYYFPDCCSTTPTSVGDRYPLMRPYLLAPNTSPPGWLPNMQLTVSAISQTQATLYWMGAADDVGVVSYLVYSGSDLITNMSADIAPHNLPFNSQYIPGTGYRYVAGNLIAGTVYTFKIVAVDEAGNRSVAALTATFSTQPPSVFSLAWWQQYWYLPALAGGAVAAVIAVFWMRWRKRVLTPPSIVTSNPSNPTR